MLWFQSLQGNCDECCTLIYGSIIPGFPSPVHSIDWGKCRYFSRAEGEEIVQTIRGPENREQGIISSQLHLSTEKENDGMYALLPHPNPLYVIGDKIIYRKCIVGNEWSTLYIRSHFRILFLKKIFLKNPMNFCRMVTC